MKRLDLRSPKTGRLLLAGSVLLLFTFYMLWQVNFYLAANLKKSYYMAFVPVLTAAALYFGGLRRETEYRLVLVYWLWYILSRILCGDRALEYEFVPCVDLSLMLPCLLTGLVLEREERRRALNCLCAVAGGYYCGIALISFYTFVRRVMLVSPITGGHFGILPGEDFVRIVIMDYNVDVTSCWFMMAFFLMLYAFFACKNKLWRIPAALAGLILYAGVSITFTRSVMLSMSLALALLVSALVWLALRDRSRRLAVLLAALVFLPATAGLYLSHGLISSGFSALSRSVTATAVQQEAEPHEAPVRRWAPGTLSAQTEPEPSPEPTPEPTPDPYADPRTWTGDLDRFSSGRIEIYKGAFYTLKQHPIVMLRGSLQKDYVDAINEVIRRPIVHFQNYLLEVLVLTGIPGLLLVLAFTILVAVKGLRLLFAPKGAVPLEERVYALPVAAILLYGMFERCIFTYTDERSIYFFLFAGLLLSAFRGAYPPAEAEKPL